MSTLTKADIAEQLVAHMGFHPKEAKEFVDNFFAQIRQTLASGQTVKLSGFGNFNLRDKVARPGRNPKTGESAIIAPRRVVTFKAGLKFKNRIESNQSKP